MFKEIKIDELKENAVDLFNRQWALLTAGNKDGYNTMTVSWGALGELWGMDMATVYVRPQRYTKRFMDENEFFTVSVYPEEYRKALAFCGSKSGRDYDKAKETGLTPVYDGDITYFDEAKIVLVCRKTAVGKFDAEQFCDSSIIESCYPTEDFHFIYYGKIERVLIKE